MASLVASLALQRGGGGGAFSGLFLVFVLAIAVFVIAAWWKVFVKAGHPGWAAIVPIYNVIILLKIAGRPLWWIILMFVPLVNLVITIIVSIDVAKHFGKGVGFGIGLAFLGFIFFPILAWGDAQYHA